MAQYTRNAVYTKISAAIEDRFPGVYCTSRYVAKPPSYPACYIHEIDRYRPIENVQLDFQDVQWESSFEIQIISNKGGTAMSEAYSIMDVARSAFSNLYYRQFSEATVDGTETFTVIGRFRRVIGGGDVIPEV